MRVGQEVVKVRGQGSDWTQCIEEVQCPHKNSCVNLCVCVCLWEQYLFLLFAAFTQSHQIIMCKRQKEILSSFKASYSAASQRRNLPSPFCGQAT